MTHGVRPLEGVSVVEFGQFVAAPGAGLILADLGASVVKVESLQGDLGRTSPALFTNFNRGKRSFAVNLRSDRGAALARRVASESDVVLQNLRPGVVERFGLDAATLRSSKPNLIYVSITGFGRTGPSAQRPGFDVAAQAESGMMSINGDAAGPPTQVGFTVVDVSASYTAVQAVCAALFAREKTGRGASLDISLLGVAMHLQGLSWSQYFESGDEPTRHGNGVPYLAPADDLFQTLDGHVVIEASLPTHWLRLCDTVGRPELATDERFVTNDRRVEHRAELLRALAPFFRERTTEEAIEHLTAAGVVAGAVNTYSEVLKHPDVVAAGIVREIEKPGGGMVKAIATPIDEPSWTGGSVAAAPRLGEHTREVLSAVGCRESEILELVSDDVVLTDDAID